MKRIILSLMTSGFSAEKNAITRIMAKVIGEDRKFDNYILPYNKEYEGKAFEKSGLDQGILCEKGVLLETGLFGFRKFIFDISGSLHENKPLLIGYNNVEFDISFLENSGFDVKELVKFKILDLYPFVVGLDYMGFFKNREIVLKNHKLKTVCEEIGIFGGKEFDKIEAIEKLYDWISKELGK